MMDDSQRQSMYDAWARGKKWMRVEIYKSFTSHDDSINEWRACAEHTFGCIERPTRQTAIAAIQGKLAEEGYEISNLAELFGIDTPQRRETPSGVKLATKNILDGAKEKRTFLEWLQNVESQRKAKEGYNFWDNSNLLEHELKDPSITQKINESCAEGYKRWLQSDKSITIPPPSHDTISAAELRGYRKALKDVDKIKKSKVRIPEGKIIYKP